MSAQPIAGAAPDAVNIEIDGQKLLAPKGSMIIQAADKAGISIPRFCYHEKLSIAANCRMCLVDVEKSPKPMPACATPVMEGMKVTTRSKRALDAQRNVMEFLLVNHPLDCPICDQGGECELQDVAMGYGRSVSRFQERKRVVADEDLGPLVSTEMTRCIHCTRCVRFMDDIAGTTELGGMFRGEHTEIGTYIGRSLESELSGNIIDLCPVGALTNKVFRFRARPWELMARPHIGYHDALGSNLYLHLRRGEVLRVVPRDNEAINENWLSDRDRYSHQALTHDDRLTTPRICQNGQWFDASWEQALNAASEALKSAIARHGAEALGTFIAPNVSAEELYLAAQLTRRLGSDAIDHRLHQIDFSGSHSEPGFGAPLAEYVHARSILLVGSHPRHDAPLLGHRIRRAWRAGAQVHAINPFAWRQVFGLSQALIGSPEQQLADLAAVARAAGGASFPAEWTALADAARNANAAAAIAKSLSEAAPSRILFGDTAARHPRASLLRKIARFVAEATGAVFDELPQGANAKAAWRVGAVSATAVSRRKAYVLYGCEAPQDFAHGQATVDALKNADAVIAFAAFSHPTLTSSASVIFPIGLPPEVEGSYVNVDGTVQTLSAGAKAPGEVRPGWRVLRALGAKLGLPGFDFIDFAALHAQVVQQLASAAAPIAGAGEGSASAQDGGFIVQREMPIYNVDSVVRRASSLQGTVIADDGSLGFHPEDALALGVGQSGTVSIDGMRYAAKASVEVPRGVVRVPNGTIATIKLPVTGTAVQVTHG